MAIGSKYLHCTLLIYQLVLMILSLTVIVVGSMVLAELMSHKAFVDGDITPPTTQAPPKVKGIGDFLNNGNQNNVNHRGSTINLLGAPSLLIAAGVLSVIVAAFGFFATLKTNIHFLRAFVFLMVIVLAMEMAAGIWAFAVRSRARSSIRITLFNKMENYEFGINAQDIIKSINKKTLPTMKQTHPWDILQKQLECCGVDGPGDYLNRGAIPMSCCAPMKRTQPSAGNDGKKMTATTTTISPIFQCLSIRQNGCLDSLDGFVREKLAWIGFFGVAVTFVEVAGTMLAVMYTVSMKKELQKIYN